MFQEFEPGEEKFRGQRLLTTGLLVLLAVGMIALAIKQIAAGQWLESDLPAASNGVVPVEIAVSGSNSETPLAAISPDQSGKLSQAGWLKTSAVPGEPGVSVIAVKADWPVAKLKTGDRLEIGGSAGEKLTFEVTGGPVVETVALKTANTTSLSELKLVVLDPGSERKGSQETISARLVQVAGN